MAINFAKFFRSLFSGSNSKPAPAPIPPTPSEPLDFTLAFVVFSDGRPVPGATIRVNVSQNAFLSRVSNGDGYVSFQVPRSLAQSYVTASKDGFKPLEQHLELKGDNVEIRLEIASERKVFSLEELAQIRGAMWTARGPVPWGPRPGQADNCICIDYFECFTPAEQDQIIQLYVKDRNYTHAPMGPIVDAGYHGQLPSCDWRSNPDVYLDAALKLEDNGCHVIHFIRPDAGCAGLEWTVEDLERELGPVFRTQKAQDTMRIVCIGWEPGGRYYYDNAWWVQMAEWLAKTFPNALRLIHMVADCDAPTGGDDEKKFPAGQGNAMCWANVAPYLHGWLIQNAGYVNQDNPIPSDAFVHEFLKQFGGTGSMKDRFTNGYAGWPTSSAWGPGKGLKVYAAEFAAFGNYWKNFAESESRKLGQMAIAAGADGSFDGC
jgi:hypothetical protein